MPVRLLCDCCAYEKDRGALLCQSPGDLVGRINVVPQPRVRHEALRHREGQISLRPKYGLTRTRTGKNGELGLTFHDRIAIAGMGTRQGGRGGRAKRQRHGVDGAHSRLLD